MQNNINCTKDIDYQRSNNKKNNITNENVSFLP